MNAYRVASILFSIGLIGGPGLAQDSSEGCSVCHKSHYEQWLQSPHALAWKSPEFQAQLKAFGNADFCGGCHAPQTIWRQVNMRPGKAKLQAVQPGSTPSEYTPELLAERAKARDSKDEGVSCGSCHFVEVLWPWGDANETLGPYHTERGHGGKPAADFDSFRLCGACHGRAVADYRPEGVSDDAYYHSQNREFKFGGGESDCSGCHMAPSQAKLTHLRIFRDLPERTVREHSFVGDRYKLLADQIELELQPGSPRVSLVITNKGVGHPVRVKPSTRLVLDVLQLRRAQPVGQLVIDFPTAPSLGTGESRQIPLELSIEKGDSLRFELLRKGPGNFREALMERTLVW